MRRPTFRHAKLRFLLHISRYRAPFSSVFEIAGRDCGSETADAIAQSAPPMSLRDVNPQGAFFLLRKPVFQERARGRNAWSVCKEKALHQLRKKKMGSRIFYVPRRKSALRARKFYVGRRIFQLAARCCKVEISYSNGGRTRKRRWSNLHFSLKGRMRKVSANL